MKKALKEEEINKSIIVEKLPGYFLLLCLIGILIFSLYVIWPFVTVLFISAFIAIAFYPVYKKILKLFRNWRKTASFVSIILVVLVVLIPLTLLVLLLTSEAVDTYELIKLKVETGEFDKYIQWSEGGFFYDLLLQLEPIVDFDSINIKENIVSLAQSLSSFLASQTVNILQGVSSVLLSLIVLLFSLFYFFLDGETLVQKVGILSPLPSAYEEELFKKIKSMVKAIMFGVFLTAIIQGTIGGIGFAIVKIPNPVFWGAVMAFFSLVPIVGTAIVWGPAALIMFSLGNYGAAIFLVLWGVLFVGTIDNFVKPYLIGSRTHTYPLMTFLVVLGGIMTMGLKGVIVGPLVLIVLMSFLHIYESEYKRLLKR